VDDCNAVITRHSSRAQARSYSRYLLVQAPVRDGRAAREHQSRGLWLPLGLTGQQTLDRSCDRSLEGKRKVFDSRFYLKHEIHSVIVRIS
jgi:hypothetical protein